MRVQRACNKNMLDGVHPQTAYPVHLHRSVVFPTKLTNYMQDLK